MSGRGGSRAARRGQVAEEAAAAWLEARGYRVVARNFRTRYGEIDCVAWDGEVLCFVEVRLRGPGSLGDALATVDVPKQRRLVRAAGLYLSRRRGPVPFCRFDVVAARPEGAGFAFDLLQDAFLAT